jgi:hypothetical protein
MNINNKVGEAIALGDGHADAAGQSTGFTHIGTYFYARSQKSEEKLLASSCLSVCLSAWKNSAST